MDLETPDDTSAHVATYLLGAGWEWLETVPSELAMALPGDEVTLSFHYLPATRSARLVAELRQGDWPAPAGAPAGLRAELRIEAESRELLGLLCWMTSHQDELTLETCSDWLAEVARFCPDTYAVVSEPGLPERHARLVAPGDLPAVVH